jgi:hypothetical protein
VAGNVGNSATAITVRYHPGTADGTVSYAGDSSAPAVYLWGMQAEQAGWPSSYIPRLDATAASRSADNMYIDFSPARDFEPMTILTETVEVGGRYLAGGPRLFQFGQAGGASTAPRLLLYAISTTDVRLAWQPVSATGTANRNHPSVGSRAAYRSILHPEGAVQLGISVDGAAETLSAKGTVQGIDGTYDRLQIGANTAGTVGGLVLLRRLRIARGVRSLESMQRL